MSSENEEIVYKSGNNYVKKVDRGYLIPQDSPESLAEAVIRAIDEKDKFDNKQIADYTKTNYSQETITNQLIDTFEDTIEIKEKESKKEQDDFER